MKGYLSEEGVDRDTDELTSWLGSERGRPVGPVLLPNLPGHSELLSG